MNASTGVTPRRSATASSESRRIAVVARGAVGRVEDEEHVEAGAVVAGLGDELRAPIGIARTRASRSASGERLERLPTRVRVERGAVREPGEQTDEPG